MHCYVSTRDSKTCSTILVRLLLYREHVSIIGKIGGANIYISQMVIKITNKEKRDTLLELLNKSKN